MIKQDKLKEILKEGYKNFSSIIWFIIERLGVGSLEFGLYILKKQMIFFILQARTLQSDIFKLNPEYFSS